MNTFVLDIFDDELPACAFYTVRWDDQSINETNRFFEKFNSDLKYTVYIQQLAIFLFESIGTDHGARDELFNRFENEVMGLPVQGKVKIETVFYHYPEFPLRLYALRLSEQLVILFNGGVKDGPTNQTSSLHMKWREACAFARRIIEAIQNEEIIIDHENRTITCSGNLNEYLL